MLLQEDKLKDYLFDPERRQATNERATKKLIKFSGVPSDMIIGGCSLKGRILLDMYPVGSLPDTPSNIIDDERLTWFKNLEKLGDIVLPSIARIAGPRRIDLNTLKLQVFQLIFKLSESNTLRSVRIRNDTIPARLRHELDQDQDHLYIQTINSLDIVQLTDLFNDLQHALYK
jgi:hypothetical protein